MKRFWFVALVLLVAAGLYASTAITINPSEMKNGETKKLVDGDKTVSVTRNGDAVDIRIEGAGGSDHLTITRGNDGIRIDRDGGLRSFAVPRDFIRPEIRTFRFNDGTVPGAQTWFVCPKDHTMMRVPKGEEDKSFKCPVDGTTMEKRKAHGFTFFYDNDEGDSL